MHVAGWAVRRPTLEASRRAGSACWSAHTGIAHASSSSAPRAVARPGVSSGERTCSATAPAFTQGAAVRCVGDPVVGMPRGSSNVRPPACAYGDSHGRRFPGESPAVGSQSTMGAVDHEGFVTRSRNLARMSNSGSACVVYTKRSRVPARLPALWFAVRRLPRRVSKCAVVLRRIDKVKRRDDVPVHAVAVCHRGRR